MSSGRPLVEEEIVFEWLNDDAGFFSAAVD